MRLLKHPSINPVWEGVELVITGVEDEPHRYRAKITKGSGGIPRSMYSDSFGIWLTRGSYEPLNLPTPPKITTPAEAALWLETHAET